MLKPNCCFGVVIPGAADDGEIAKRRRIVAMEKVGVRLRIVSSKSRAQRYYEGAPPVRRVLTYPALLNRRSRRGAASLWHRRGECRRMLKDDAVRVGPEESRRARIERIA